MRGRRVGSAKRIADSISTGDEVIALTSKTGGFTAMELIVGIALTFLLALALGPLVVSIQNSAVCEGDRSVSVLQGRVAAARLERDLRTASAESCPFETNSPLLQASSRQIAFLCPSPETETLLIVEWELVGSALMRRWGTCPSQKPELISHTAYIDNKTMLEGLGAGSSFTFVVEGVGSVSDVSESDLSRVRIVNLSCDGADGDGEWSTLARVIARVGR